MSRLRLDVFYKHRLAWLPLWDQFHAHLHKWQNPLGFSPTEPGNQLWGVKNGSHHWLISLCWYGHEWNICSVSLAGIDFPSLPSIGAHAGLHARGIFSWSPWRDSNKRTWRISFPLLAVAFRQKGNPWKNVRAFVKTWEKHLKPFQRKKTSM